MLKQPMNYQMIRSAPRPWDMYNSRKKDISTNDWRTKILSFPLHCGSIDMIIKIYSNYVMLKENINFRKEKKKGVDIEH